MTISRTQAILFGVAALLIVIVAFLGGRGFGCEPPEPPPVVLGIDAGPGESEIEARLDAALVAGAAHIEEIEEKFEEDMAAFDEHQREEYERLRGGDDLEEAARFLSEWNRRRHGAAPRGRWDE
jgi:hypothetical protein